MHSRPVAIRFQEFAVQLRALAWCRLRIAFRFGLGCLTFFLNVASLQRTRRFLRKTLSRLGRNVVLDALACPADTVCTRLVAGFVEEACDALLIPESLFAASTEASEGNDLGTVSGVHVAKRHRNALAYKPCLYKRSS